MCLIVLFVGSVFFVCVLVVVLSMFDFVGLLLLCVCMNMVCCMCFFTRLIVCLFVVVFRLCVCWGVAVPCMSVF